MMIRIAFTLLLAVVISGCWDDAKSPIASELCAELTPEELRGEVETDSKCPRIGGGYKPTPPKGY